MVDRLGQKKMDALCNITLKGCKWENGYPTIATSEILTHDISRLHTRITRVKHTNIKKKRNIMFPANVYHSLALERPLTQLIKALRPKWPWVHDRRLIKDRQIGDFRCNLRWLDWIFGGWYLPTLSINYVGMSKGMEKRLPQLYYIKMKISYDLGFIAFGVAMAT